MVSAIPQRRFGNTTNFEENLDSECYINIKFGFLATFSEFYGKMFSFCFLRLRLGVLESKIWKAVFAFCTIDLKTDDYLFSTDCLVLHSTVLSPFFVLFQLKNGSSVDKLSLCACPLHPSPKVTGPFLSTFK